MLYASLSVMRTFMETVSGTLINDWLIWTASLS